MGSSLDESGNVSDFVYTTISMGWTSLAESGCIQLSLAASETQRTKQNMCLGTGGTHPDSASPILKSRDPPGLSWLSQGRLLA